MRAFIGVPSAAPESVSQVWQKTKPDPLRFYTILHLSEGQHNLHFLPALYVSVDGLRGRLEGKGYQSNLTG